jgi:hypothetical protein
LVPEIRFENMQGLNLVTLPEWEPAWIVIHGQWQDLPQLELRLSGQTLPLQWNPSHQRLQTLWQRRSAGLYHLALFQADKLVLQMSLAVWPEGWGVAGLLNLLEDLYYLLPVEWGNALATGKNHWSGAYQKPARLRGWRQEFALLQALVLGNPQSPGLLQALAIWQPQLNVGKAKQIIEVERYQARSPVMTGSSLFRGKRISDRRPDWSADNAENRFVKALVTRLEQRMQQLAQWLGAKAELPVKQELLDWLKQLRQLYQSKENWSQIQARQTLPLLALTSRPDYQPFLRIWQRLSESFVFTGQAGHIHRSIEQLPSLYQTWCMIQVLLALKREAEKLGWKVISDHWVFGQDREWIRVLPRGEIVLTLQHPQTQAKIEVYAERQFGKMGPIQSMSYEQRPDLVALWSQAEKPYQIWLWDAKYRLGENLNRPQKGDIDRMHAYRDAIGTESGKKLVSSACILYPGPSMRYSPGLEALCASPLKKETLGPDLSRQISALFLLNFQKQGYNTPEF